MRKFHYSFSRGVLRLAIALASLVCASEIIAAPAPARVASIWPRANAGGVPLRPTIKADFTVSIGAEANPRTRLFLVGPSGKVPLNINLSSDGRTLSAVPLVDLTPASGYTLIVRDSPEGTSPPRNVAVDFRTKTLAAGEPGAAAGAVPPRTQLAAAGSDPDMWIPGQAQQRGAWTTSGSPVYDRRLASRGQSVAAPLVAPTGVTAVSGIVSRVNGNPLQGVTVSIGTTVTKTDKDGRFLLAGVPAGASVLTIDATYPGPGNSNYGQYLYRVFLKDGATTIVPETFWMTKLDPRGTVNLPSPTTKEVVVRNPSIPGLELRIPAGTVIRDRNGNVVTQINITALPIDRPPFPLPGFDVPVYFTIQPGGAWLQGVSSGSAPGARLLYPNKTNELAGALASFWNYDPSEKEWYIYGTGKVSTDRKQVIPDPGVIIYQFSGAMINSGVTPPGVGPAPGCGVGGLGPAKGNGSPGGPGGSGDPGDGSPPNGDNGPKNPSGADDCNNGGGDPVDAGTGLFVHENTDLFLPDVWPLALVRTYRQGDANSRPFGVGMLHPYESFLWSANQYQEADLILPNGGRVHYVRTSPGTGFMDAAFESTNTPTRFYKSTITWNGLGWDLKLRDGTVFVYGDTHPLQSIRDRYGNTINFARTGTDGRGKFGNITELTSPNGRSIRFTYDASNRITSATDNIGRSVTYAYDAYGRLTTITDPAGGQTIYGWGTCTGSQASCTWLTSITDARGVTKLSNAYDANGRVQTQTLPDSATYQFQYTLSGGNVTQTDITNPRGDVTRKAFANGYVTATTRALGKPEQRVTTISRDSQTNQVNSVTDGLGRTTSYGRDSQGNVTSVTKLAGTAGANATLYTYEPVFSQVASVVNPAGLTTTFTYDSLGNRTSAADPLGHQTSFTYTPIGQVKSVVDPLGYTTTFTYSGADLIGITNALGQIRNFFVDAVGRITRAVDPSGATWKTEYDKLNRPTRTTDPLGNSVSSAYDASGNRVSFSTPRGGTITWVYDSMSRVTTRTDALGASETYTYDAAGNLSSFTDRKGQRSGFAYDWLSRLTSVGYGASASTPSTYSSTTTFVYDAANRPTQINDSRAGTINRSYDGLDNLVSESSALGTVSFTYDVLSRRSTISAPSQSNTTYTYDNANRLSSLSRGTATVSITYDNADRRVSVGLPNGVQTQYQYDLVDRPVAISYVVGTSTIGNLAHTYSGVGTLIAKSGSFARTNLPAPISGATYDLGDRLTAWDGSALTHDANGNLSSGLGQTFAWNDRNQLSMVTASVAPNTTTYSYDGIGRRIAKQEGATTQFVYDGIQPIQERDGGGALSAYLLTIGLDEILTRNVTGGSEIMLLDELGSVIRITAANAAKIVDYTYEAYGKATADSPSASSNAFKFTGRDVDLNGLQYNRARYYSPTLSRFLSEDPLGIGGGPNLFSYVGGNPISNIDPLGLWSVTFGGYLGVGGQVTFGSDNGNGFLTGRFGFGLGGGFSYNPAGGIPGPEPQDRSSGGVVLSCSAKANFNAGPLSTSLEKGVARNYSNAESAVYGGASASARDRFSGLNASGSVGGQITIYSGNR